MEVSFRPSVYGVIIKDDKILLSPQFDGYDFPGEGIDIDELITDALVREIKEETGLDAKPQRIIYASDAFFFHPRRKKAFHTPLLYYLCEVTGGELSTDGFDEHEKEYAKMAEWIPLKKVSSLKFCNPIDSSKLIRDAIKIKEQLRL